MIGPVIGALILAGRVTEQIVNVDAHAHAVPKEVKAAQTPW